MRKHWSFLSSIRSLTIVLVAIPPLLLAEDSPIRGRWRMTHEPATTSATQVTSGQTFDVIVGANFSTSFNPSALTITAGDTVRWTWQGSNHSVTGGNCTPSCTADSKFCSPDDTSCPTAAISNSGFAYSHTFSQPGTYRYFCKFYGSAMKGTITVLPLLKITDVMRETTGQNAGHFMITGQTRPDATVTIQVSDSLNGFGFLGSAIADNAGTFHYDDGNTSTVQGTMRFYHATLP
jgi:plastocyanin